MHKTLNHCVRGIIDGDPERWEAALPYAQMALRAAPMKCLGGRSPYEVVTGLRPRMPHVLKTGLPVESRTVDEYVVQGV